MSSDLDQLSFNVFSQHVHTQFVVRIDASTSIAIELASTIERPTAPDFECFSLLFLGPESPLLRQGLHSLEHPTLGTLDLFLVPIGKGARGVSYEAVFNRKRVGSRA